MTRRTRGWVACAVSVAVAGALVGLGGQVAGQAPPGARTPWGEPDLQGIYTNAYDTPLQRSARFADKEFFSDEERAQLDRARMNLLSEDQRPHQRGSEQDVGGAYNSTIFLTHKPTGKRTSLIVDPPNGRVPPFTPEAQARRAALRQYEQALLQATDVCKKQIAGCQGGTFGPPSPRRNEPPPMYPVGSINRADGPEDRGLSERCMSARLPDYSGAAGFVLQIGQSKGVVSIFYDTGQGQGWQRIIPITARPHLPAHLRFWWGDSRGRWEGNTLVVDVTNFSAKTDFQGSRENLHLVERWTRTDAQTIEYEVTVEDPTTWTQPWRIKQELGKQPDGPNRIYKEPRCHEGNHGMPAMLAGARTAERAFAQGRGPDPAKSCISGCGGFEVVGIDDVDLEEGPPRAAR
ncbi:MAG: hypothetical protein FJW27_06325 [Acidimicrobiia bacterium]|nr:hypothetical protein [Acidimicrobiia bacterium]